MSTLIEQATLRLQQLRQAGAVIDDDAFAGYSAPRVDPVMPPEAVAAAVDTAPAKPAPRPSVSNWISMRSSATAS